MFREKKTVHTKRTKVFALWSVTIYWSVANDGRRMAFRVFFVRFNAVDIIAVEFFSHYTQYVVYQNDFYIYPIGRR